MPDLMGNPAESQHRGGQAWTKNIAVRDGNRRGKHDDQRSDKRNDMPININIHDVSDGDVGHLMVSSTCSTIHHSGTSSASLMYGLALVGLLYLIWLVGVNKTTR
ncbi:hypothetical protein F5Y03DRAFT_398841 [Xylaria venustula]|nr:hypothetical protein F5Y03DRAFT_398841 [Xylaria venustula]